MTTEPTPDNNKVIVAISGGVDSAVAAGLLQARGLDVTGLFIHMGAGDFLSNDHANDETVDRAASDARQVAQTLGIELVTADLSSSLRSIVDEFVAEYVRGRTPNPCILCNSRIKFAALARLADERGAAHMATGHYARVVTVNGGRLIARAGATDRDQSYALFDLSRADVARAVLPLGDIANKDDVRRLAESMNLSVHDRPDSQDICFTAGGDYTSLLMRRCPQGLRSGNIVNARGEVVGTHNGYARFTIGQRRGLGVAAGEPIYVTRINPSDATVTVGRRKDLLSRHLRASRANWHCRVKEKFDAIVQIRYNHRGAPGIVRVTSPDTFEVDFTEDVSAITPGQATVVYDRDDHVLGGGWID